MADEAVDNESAVDASCSSENVKSNDSLESFITEEYNKQQREENDTDIDEERKNAFFERALAESRRMSTEVNKSREQLTKLHTELGEKIFHDWRQEHGSQVLSSEQQILLEMAATYPL